MIGFAFAFCLAAFFYAIYLLAISSFDREMRLRRRLPNPANREGWLRQQKWLREELGR